MDAVDKPWDASTCSMRFATCLGDCLWTMIAREQNRVGVFCFFDLTKKLNMLLERSFGGEDPRAGKSSQGSRGDNVYALVENTMVFSAIEELRKDTKTEWKKLADPLEQVIEANNTSNVGLKKWDCQLTHMEDVMDGRVSANRVKVDGLCTDLLSFLEMLAACLYLPCLPQTCLRFPRLVPASLPLSLPCHVFRMVFTGVSVVSRVPLSSPESLSCPQSSLSSEFFRDPSRGFLLSS